MFSNIKQVFFKLSLRKPLYWQHTLYARNGQ